MKHKKAFRPENTFQSVLSGLITGVAVTVLSILLIAAVLVKYDIPTDMIKYLLFFPAVIGGLLSGFVAGRFVRSKGFLWGFVSALSVSFLFILTLTLINSFNISFLLFIFVPVYSVFGSIGGITAANLR